MSKSEVQVRLDQIVRRTPGIELHPYSPSGPFVRVVLWRTPDCKIRGQVGWYTDAEVGTACWAVRAFHEQNPESTLTMERIASEKQGPGAIARVIDRVLAAYP